VPRLSIPHALPVAVNAIHSSISASGTRLLSRTASFCFSTVITGVWCSSFLEVLRRVCCLWCFQGRDCNLSRWGMCCNCKPSRCMVWTSSLALKVGPLGLLIMLFMIHECWIRLRLGVDRGEPPNLGSFT